MPELPEVEAWRRALNDPVSAFPVEQAGPAHIATLKTFDPPLSTLEGRRFAGAERRAKRLLFPTEDGELVLLVHLMSARPDPLRAHRREEPEDRGLPPALPGWRRAGAHRRRAEEARRGLAAYAGGGRGGAGPPRPGGARPRRRAARRDPGGRAADGCTRSCATSASFPGSAAPGRTRSCTRRSCPLSPRRRDCPRDRSRSSLRRSTASSSAASSYASAALRTRRSTASTRSCTSRATYAARRSSASTSRSTRSSTARSVRRAGAC